MTVRLTPSLGTQNKQLIIVCLEVDGFELDSKSSLAVFAIARKKSNRELDSYLIYQAKDDKVMYGTNTNSSGSVGPASHAVFGGADHLTSLACITAGADDDGIPLTSETDLNRCYFQRRVELIEVTFDGLKWAASGPIPLAEVNYKLHSCSRAAPIGIGQP